VFAACADQEGRNQRSWQALRAGRRQISADCEASLALRPVQPDVAADVRVCGRGPA